MIKDDPLVVFESQYPDYAKSHELSPISENYVLPKNTLINKSCSINFIFLNEKEIRSVKLILTQKNELGNLKIAIFDRSVQILVKVWRQLRYHF